MAYWRKVARRAAKEAAEAIGMGSGERAVVGLFVQGVIAVLIYIGLGATELHDNAGTRIATAFAPFAAFPVVFLWKLLRAPAKLDAEREAELLALSASGKAPKHVIAIAAEALSHPPDLNQMALKVGISNTSQTTLLVEGAHMDIHVNDTPWKETRGTGFLLHGGADRSYDFLLGVEPARVRDGTIKVAIELIYGLPDEPPSRIIDQQLRVTYQYRGAITYTRCSTERLAEIDR